MNILILGRGCANCERLQARTQRAVDDLGIDATIEKITDDAAIAGYGIMRTPGLVVDDQVVLSGRVPTAAAIGELLAARR
jgi:small redox-active disulfide protein 2